MKLLSNSICAACCLALLPLVATGETNDVSDVEGRAVGETIFSSIDTSTRGMIHLGDLEEFRASVFAGMDFNDNGNVTYEEFSVWDPGFAPIAENVGRGDAYTTASKIVFAFWDLNGDGDLTQREMRLAMNADFRRADLSNDGLLTQDEFIGGFPIMVAMRAAIRPDL